MSKKRSTRENIIAYLFEEYQLETKDDVFTLSELKGVLEKEIIEIALESKDIIDDLKKAAETHLTDGDTVEVFERLELPVLNIHEVSEELAERYPESEYTNFYTTFHKLISNSEEFLVKPTPGNVYVNYDVLSFPGTKQSMKRSQELYEFSESMQDTWEKLNDLMSTLKADTEEKYIVTNEDYQLLEEEWRLLSEAIGRLKMYQLKNK